MFWGMCTRKSDEFVFGWPAAKGDMDGWVYLFNHTHGISSYINATSIAEQREIRLI